MQTSASDIFAIVLAAGAASRFGATKQLSAIGDSTLVGRTTRLAESVCNNKTVLVTGHDWREVAAACSPLAGFLVRNDDYGSGLGGSIACGVRAVAGAADAALIMLADQPLITAEHCCELIDTWTLSPASIVATGYAGTQGPPVLFPRENFAALSSLAGDVGARSVIEQNRDRVLSIEFEAAAIDIDRPEDLARIY